MKYFISIVIALLALCNIAISGEIMYDKYGGWSGLKATATGFFRVEKMDGIWWLVDPEGNAFISKGVNHISFTADNAPSLGYSPYGRVTKEKYGDIQSWAVAALQRLKKWNFNTIGSWSNSETFDKGMPYTMILGLGEQAGGSWISGHFPDVFSDNFRKSVEAQAEKLCSSQAEDPFLLGYFLDNELRWGADWRSSNSLFDDFLTMPADTGLYRFAKIIRKYIRKVRTGKHA